MAALHMTIGDQLSDTWTDLLPLLAVVLLTHSRIE